MSKPPALSGSLLECYKLLKKVMNHQYAWPFNQPVDPIALGIPNYFDVIKEPMDLGTIQVIDFSSNIPNLFVLTFFF